MDHTQLSGGIYDLQKDPVVLGTYESSAFILSFRDSEEFHSIHSFGYHRIPHIGVYGNDYSLSPPMVLLSLPPTPSYLQRLPPDLLNALDLQEILVQKPVEVTSKTKLELFSEHICAILQDQSGLNPELRGRIVARELVKLVISSACETVQMNGSSCFMGRGSLGDFSEFRDLKGESDVSAGDLENVGGFMKWREAKRDSTVSAMSLDSETLAGGEIATVVEECNEMEEQSSPVTRNRQNGCKRVSVRVRPDIIVHIMDSEDDELQIAAKKLVKKVLHSACKRLESLYRRSSIEYLTASTKRMRIAESPLPPQTLLEEDPPPISPPVPAKYSKVHPQTWPPKSLKQTHPEVSVAACGTPSFTDLLSPSYLLSNCQEGRRNPVQSNPRLQTKRPRPKDSRSPSPSESLPGFKSPAFVEPPLSPPPLQREDSPTHSWRKLGKKRGRSESHDIMMLKELDKFRESKLGQKLQQMTDKFSGILNPRRIVARVQSSQDQLPPYPNGGGLSVNSLASTMERMSIAEAQSESGTECDTTDEEYTVLSPVTKRPPQLEGEVCASELDCTENARGFQSLPATLNGISVEAEGDDHFTSSCPEINSQSEDRTHCHTPGQTAYGNCHSVPEMDLFVIIHTYPPPGICQKFLCNNTNEVNLMYHCWLFPDLPFDPKVTRSDWLEVGVFQPFGVQPVHLDLQDAGVAFYFLDPRTVCVHDCRFSPENTQLQLSRGVQFHSFFSAAKHGTRRVVSYHVIPANPSVELSVRECIQCCSTLGELVTKLSYSFPEVGQHLLHLISISPPKM